MLRFLFITIAFACCAAPDAAGVGEITRAQSAATLRQFPNVQQVAVPAAADPAARGLAVSMPKSFDPETGATFTYDAVGNRTGVRYANGVETTYVYNRRNFLIELTTSKDGVTIHHQVFTVDATGRRTGLLEDDATGPLRAIEWEYDGLYRLTKEAILAADSALSRTTQWTYDKVGNRLSQTVLLPVGGPITTTYVYNANDWLVSETTTGGDHPGTTNYSYDANGNRLTKTAPGEFIEYQYNDAGRMKEMRSAGTRVLFAYDADGLLLTKTVLPVTGAMVAQHFVWDHNRKTPQIIEELTSTAGGAFQPSAFYTFADELIAQTRDGATSYVLADGMGSTRALTDSVGNVTDKISYDAFGNVIQRSGDTTVTNLYRGEQRDPNSGFYNLRARWMDPASGRFTQMDTWGGRRRSPSTLNKFVYADSEPVNHIDPTGHATLLEAGIALSVGVVIGLNTVPAYIQYSNHGNPFRHYYEVETTVCNRYQFSWCDAKGVYQWMLYAPAPVYMSTAERSTPVQDKEFVSGIGGGEFWQFGGDIQVFLDPASFYQRNETQVLFHALCCGSIERWAIQDGDSVKIKTVGKGWNYMPALAASNEVVGKQIFHNLDIFIEDLIERGPAK
jgi:RHS repeat-associated protein